MNTPLRHAANPARVATATDAGDRAAFICLAALLVTGFAIAGGSRHDIASLLIWRPLTALALVAAPEARVASQPARANGLRADEVGRATLTHSPLSPRSLWLIAMANGASGRPGSAERAMEQASMLLRRDPMVQWWLLEAAVRRNDQPKALDHLDALLLTSVEARGPLLTRLTVALANPDARQAIRAYVRNDNPWLENFFGSAANSGRSVRPFADLLLGVEGPLPSSPEVRTNYAQVLMRLAAEGEHQSLVQLYRRLPNASDAAHSSSAATVTGVYPPIDWAFPEEGSVTGAIMPTGERRAGLEVYADAGTSGIAALKYVTPRRARRFSWQVIDSNTNVDGDARWTLRCVAGSGAGAIARSANLLAVRGQKPRAGVDGDAPVDDAGPLNFGDDASTGPSPRAFLNLRQNCAAMRIEMAMIGGTGQEPASLLIDHLRLD